MAGIYSSMYFSKKTNHIYRSGIQNNVILYGENISILRLLQIFCYGENYCSGEIYQVQASRDKGCGSHTLIKGSDRGGGERVNPCLWEGPNMQGFVIKYIGGDLCNGTFIVVPQLRG